MVSPWHPLQCVSRAKNGVEVTSGEIEPFDHQHLLTSQIVLLNGHATG